MAPPVAEAARQDVTTRSKSERPCPPRCGPAAMAVRLAPPERGDAEVLIVERGHREPGPGPGAVDFHGALCVLARVSYTTRQTRTSPPRRRRRRCGAAQRDPRPERPVVFLRRSRSRKSRSTVSRTGSGGYTPSRTPLPRALRQRRPRRPGRIPPPPGTRSRSRRTALRSCSPGARCWTDPAVPAAPGRRPRWQSAFGRPHEMSSSQQRPVQTAMRFLYMSAWRFNG